MAKSKVCPDCQKGILHKGQYENKKGKYYPMLYCPLCGYQKKLSNIREVMVKKEDELEV
jgi:hypothetical protein